MVLKKQRYFVPQRKRTWIILDSESEASSVNQPLLNNELKPMSVLSINFLT